MEFCLFACFDYVMFQLVTERRDSGRWKLNKMPRNLTDAENTTKV